jgi:RimJ/RimL family protein N-acetyltransferase
VGRVLRPAAPIQTARLTLRPLTRADFDDVHAYYSRPEVARYVYWEATDPEQTREILDQNIGRAGIENEGDGLILGVVWREVGRVVGHVSLRLVSREHRQGEVGFVLNPEYQGKGLATEAAAVMLDLGFDGLGLHRIEGRCDARNLPSVRVMERLGMRREAHLRENEIFKGEWGDELIYAILEHEWRARLH